MQKSIVVIIESMTGGGAQQVASSLITYWHKKGQAVHLITFGDTPTDRFPIPKEVVCYTLPSPKNSSSLIEAVRNNFQRIYALRRILKEVNASNLLSFITETNVIAILSCLGLNYRIVVSERNDPKRQNLRSYWRFLRVLFYPLSDLIVANTKMAALYLSNYLTEDKVIFIPNPIRRPNSAQIAKKNGFMILAVGRLHAQKDYETLLKAFALARSRLMERWTLRILGTGDMLSSLNFLCFELQIEDDVEFLGYVPDPFPHYRAADLFVMTSLYEGSPNALWEALSCSLPTIISESIEGALEWLVDGEHTIVFPTRDVNALAENLVRIADSPSLRLKLGKNGSRLVQGMKLDATFNSWDIAVFGEQLKN
jgi:GalNAc-alpha-(1->4)-GalNAc-alpha-(1->3)-diNAcBac-PP-undecaprenol alpha-1,4-N-acetyl-D-galactosaminyltransferase